MVLPIQRQAGISTSLRRQRNNTMGYLLGVHIRAYHQALINIVPI